MKGDVTLLTKYRPTSLDEIKGQDRAVRLLKSISTITTSPHFLFVGRSGVGKTATAYAFANHLGVEVVEMNSSDERGIDTVREKIKTILFSASPKILLLDEADQMTKDAQFALRRLSEIVIQKNMPTRIIMTANYEYKIITAIKSRFAVLRFSPLKEETIAEIVKDVMKNESIRNDERIVQLIAKVSKGDARSALNYVEMLKKMDYEAFVSYIAEEATRVSLAKEVLNACVDGNWQKAYFTLKSLFYTHQADGKRVVEVLFDAIEELEVPPYTKLLIYKSLAFAEQGINAECNPLVQLSAFVADTIRILHHHSDMVK